MRLELSFVNMAVHSIPTLGKGSEWRIKVSQG